MFRPDSALFIAAIGLIATPAAAQVPPDVQAMIDAAIATGDAKTIETVIKLAKQTQPDSAQEIEESKAALAAAKEEQERRFGPIKVSGCVTCHRDPHPRLL